MTNSIPFMQNENPAYILGYELSEASYTELTRKLADDIIIRRVGKIDDLIEAKDLTACIIVPSIAEIQTSPHCLKNISKKDFDHLIQAFFLKKGGPTEIDFEPGISYVCNRARSGQVPSASTKEDDDLANKVLSGAIEEKDLKKIISDLCWDHNIKDLRYYSWELPTDFLGKLTDIACQTLKEIKEIATSTLKIGAVVIVGVGTVVVFKSEISAGIQAFITKCIGPAVGEVMSNYVVPAFKESIPTNT